MKILCLNYEYPPVGGGGGRIAEKINIGLAKRGHEMRVQTAGLRHLSGTENHDGVLIRRTQSFRKREDTCTVGEMGLFLATSLIPTLNTIRKWKPDLIHAHFAVPTGVLACLASRLLGTPYVLTAHLGDVPGGVPAQTDHLFRAIGPLVKPVWRGAAATTAVSSFVANLAENAYHVKPRVIPNGVPLQAAPPSIRIASPPRIIMVGRLSIQKNPLLAIRALARIRQVPWQFTVVGDGPLRTEMEESATHAEIAGRVNFTGWQSEPEVRELLAASDILLLTSHSEGLPMAAIEGLSHGLAIVSTKIPGVADIVDDGKNGILSQPDPVELSSALERILTNSPLLTRMRESSLDLAPRFDLERILDQYEDVYETARR